MLHPPVPDPDEEARRDAFAALLDPRRYVRDADWALASGRRDDAIALIAQAYLAFDVIDAG